MLIEIIISVIIGILFGTITGLIPGIHTNLIGTIIIALSITLLSNIEIIYLVVFIVSMAITHTFTSFIPSVFLGCPDTDTELSTLPGHELLKEGRGYEAVALTVYGGIAAIFILILLIFPSYLLLGNLYSFLQIYMGYILIFISIILIYIGENKINSSLVFLLTGVLGFFALNMEIKEPLLPLLTGLFGSSMILISIKTKTKIPKQEIKNPKINKNFISPLFGSVIASPLSSLLPGLGSGQAAIIGNVFSKTDKKGFLILLGSTNTLVMGFSFITLHLISKTRTGAAVAINQLMGNFSIKILILILIIMIFSGILSFFITLKITKIFSQKIHKINYKKISIITLIFLSLLVLIVSEFQGFFLFIVSTITGIYCSTLNVRRTTMMGCLLIPTIIFYLF